MGLRSLERRFLPQIGRQEIERLAEDYVRRCDEGKKILNPIEYLKKPLLEAGLNPPGLQRAVHYLDLKRPRTHMRVRKDEKGDILDAERVAPDGPRAPYEKPDLELLVRTLFTDE